MRAVQGHEDDMWHTCVLLAAAQACVASIIMCQVQPDNMNMGADGSCSTVCTQRMYVTLLHAIRSFRAGSLDRGGELADGLEHRRLHVAEHGAVGARAVDDDVPGALGLVEDLLWAGAGVGKGEGGRRGERGSVVRVGAGDGEGDVDARGRG